MKERLIQYRDKIVQYWNQTNKTQKIGFISGIVLLLLVIGVTAAMLSRTEYSNAFQDLDAVDAAAITTYLQQQGIDYRISTDGRTIGVPTTRVADVKIAVESQGLVQNGSIGYGIFKENISSFGMTDNEFNVLKSDALSGEIQQLINGMNGVDKSKVVLYVPQDNVFISDTPEQSSAAVMVWFKRGFRPDQNMIDTMYSLVSHSLPNMSVENIAISDQSGELLPSAKIGAGGNSSSLVAEQFVIKKQFENEIQRNIQSLLNRMFPPDKVVVSVVSSLNFDKKNSIQQLVEPVNTVDQRGIEISVETIQETYASEGSSDSGVAGTGETDIPGYPTAGSGGTTESESLTERINYEVNRINNEIQSSPYQIKDLTINVALEPPVKNDPASLAEDTKDAIQQILKNVVAASLADSGRTYTDEELGNKVFVLAHSFDGVDDSSGTTFITSGLFYGLLAIALAIIIAGILLAMRRRKQAVIEEEELAMQYAGNPAEPMIDLENVNNESQVRKQLESLAKKKPEEFVNLLRTWLVDE